jgi:hypothetical protein
MKPTTSSRKTQMHFKKSSVKNVLQQLDADIYAVEEV